MDNRKISLVIPVFNRFELLLESFDKVKDDPRISEICIYSDGSNEEYSSKLFTYFENFSKVELYLNPDNKGVHKAKKYAVEMSSNEWVILFDSDNLIDVDYLDIIYKYEWQEFIAYQPEFLKPHFDFRKFSGALINKYNIQEYLKVPDNKIDTFGNAQNFFINKKSYLESWKEGENVNGNDSLWFFYNWIKDGKSLYLTPNLSYFHRIHDNTTKEQAGNYNSDRGAGHKIEQTMNLIRQLANGNQPR